MVVSRGQPEHLLAADAAAAALFPVGGGSLLGIPAPFLWTLNGCIARMSE